MTTPLKTTPPTGDDYSPLGEMTGRLEAAWRQGPAPTLDPFLPSPGAPSRLRSLHAVISRDLEIAWRRRQGRMLEQYLKRYPELGPKRDLPATLIFAEYLARSLAGEPATADEYRRRFPEQFPELMRLITADAETDDQAGTLHGQRPGDSPPELPRDADTDDQAGTLHAPAAPAPFPATLPPKRTGSGAAGAHPKTIRGAPQSGAASSVHSQAGPEDAAVVLDPQGSDADSPAHAPKISKAPQPGPPPSLTPSAISQVLPVSEGFKLHKRIGRGQFGEVFLAEAPGGVNVAVKRIFRALDDESSQRELQSLELIRELRHPFLLQTQAYWSLEDRLVIVMELADGSLSEWNREVRREGGNGPPVEELLAYFREAAEALDYLHAMNVIHRDVKPANLLRLKGHAKVADFGLARMMESQQLVTATFCGTPLYMAPEVWKKKVCPQSDQYSLAATYTEMRTGRPIFPGTAPFEICMQHTSAVPDLAPLGEPEQAVLLRALAKDPEHRYPTCLAFVDALREALAPPPPATVVPAPRRERGWGVVALALGLLAVLGALVAMWALTRSAPTPPVVTTPTVAATPPKLTFLLPAGCQPEGTEADGRYFKRILHPLPTAPPVLFLLIPALKAGEAPFYIMRDKVSNGQFNAADAAGMNHLLEGAAQAGPWAVRREWNKDGRGDPDRSSLPVVYVTLPEARCFAHFLGGELPTAVQWDKAAGMYDGADGPFQPGTAPKGLAVALNRSRPPTPIPVGNPDGDESLFGCRDMADNGRELIATVSTGVDLVNLPGQLEESDMLDLRGGTFLGDEVFRFADIKKKNKGGGLPVRNAGRNDIGFRVVLEAPRDQP